MDQADLRLFLRACMTLNVTRQVSMPLLAHTNVQGNLFSLPPLSIGPFQSQMLSINYLFVIVEGGRTGEKY